MTSRGYSPEECEVYDESDSDYDVNKRLDWNDRLVRLNCSYRLRIEKKHREVHNQLLIEPLIQLLDKTLSSVSPWWPYYNRVL